MSDILNYIPQRPPFVMIDKVIHADGQVSKTSFTILQNHLFVSNGHLTEPGLIENMAQTAAAGTGFKSFQSGEAPAVGFIGALKNLSVNSLPRVDSTIITTVTFITQVLNAQIVQASISENDSEIASCELKIFIQQ